jgi:F0F1-type ATP synthase epsilon subunit
MTRMTLLTLEVVTPLGGFLREGGIDEIVMRRREGRFTPGSEVAVFPAHGPMLVRMADSELRYRKGGRLHRLRVRGGVAEVRDDVVTVMSPTAERLA